jgi:biopolymer transport protein ExbB/TolQ
MKKSLKLLIAGLILLVGGLLPGCVATLVGMLQSFNRIAASSRAPAPAEVVRGISQALIFTTIGLAVSLVGLCLVIAATIAYVVGRQSAAPPTRR